MGPSDAVTAIAVKSIDAAFICTPYPSMIEDAGYGRIVTVGGEMWSHHACCVLVASGRMIRERPDVVKQIIKTHIRATEYINKHPDEAIEVFAEKYNLNSTIMINSLNVTGMRWTYDPYVVVNDGLECSRIIYKLNKERYNKRGIELLREGDIFDLKLYEEIKTEDEL